MDLAADRDHFLKTVIGALVILIVITAVAIPVIYGLDYGDDERIDGNSLDDIAPMATNLGTFTGGTNNSSPNAAYSAISMTVVNATPSWASTTIYILPGSSVSITAGGNFVVLNPSGSLDGCSYNYTPPFGIGSYTGTATTAGQTVTFTLTNYSFSVTTVNPEYTYTLTYDANGGSGGPGQQTYGPTTDTSHTFTIPETEPTRENYSFQGWAASSESGGALWYPGETITVYSSSPSYIVYAVWALLPQYTYSLTYNANGGTDAPSQQTYGPTYDTSHVFEIVVPTPTRSGYTFEGWATSSSGPAEYQPGGEITVNSTQPAVTLFAVWEELPQYTYTLTYDANGGSGAPAQQSYGPTYDTSYTFTISSTTPTWSGYTFEGWATSSSGPVAYQPGGEITVNSAHAGTPVTAASGMLSAA